MANGAPKRLRSVLYVFTVTPAIPNGTYFSVAVAKIHPNQREFQLDPAPNSVLPVAVG